MEGVVPAELPVCVREQIGSTGTKLEVAWYVEQAKYYRIWGRQETRSNRQREPRGVHITRLIFYREK